MVASQYLKTLQRCFVHEQKSLSPEQEVVLTKFFRAALPLSSYTFVNQEFTVGGLPCAKKLTPKIVPACMRETRPCVGERYPVTLRLRDSVCSLIIHNLIKIAPTGATYTSENQRQNKQYSLLTNTICKYSSDRMHVSVSSI